MKYGYVTSFEDLLVYQKSKALARRVFEITCSFPSDEKFSLTDQVRRSSRSVGAQIAEAWAKRRYEKHFISKLTDSDGEQLETRHWIGVASDCLYITEEIRLEVRQELESIGRMLNTMIQKSASFCSANDGWQLREEIEEYFVNKPPNTEHRSLNTDHRSPNTENER